MLLAEAARPRATAAEVMNAIAMRSMFTEPKGYFKRRTRSNKGVPRKRPVVQPMNVIQVNNGGVVHVNVPKRTRVSKHATNENRKAARRASAKKYRNKKKAERWAILGR